MKISEQSAQADEVQALKALGHPLRLRIMRHLAAAPETLACEFAKVFDVPQPAVSQHLKVLRDAQLVQTHRDGNQIAYSVAADALAAVARTVEALSDGAR
jgi:DNA-binding transcriptional ArsR family regulator